MTQPPLTCLLIAAAFASGLGLLGVPVALGYLEGPHFPVAGPGLWEALKQVARELRFHP